MKYQLSILALLFVTVMTAFGQNRTITGTGDWNDPGIWTGGNIADELAENVIMNNGTFVTLTSPLNYTVGNYSTGNNNTLTIDAGAELNIGSSGNPRDFNSSNNTVINVYGTLIIWGDLVVNNNLILVVTGTLIIKGNVNMNNGGALNVSGNMVVDGNFTGNNNTEVNVDGSIAVGGSVNVGNNAILTGSGTFTGGSCTQGSGTFCNSGTFNGLPLYSRKSGTWRDVTGGVGGTGTWSTVSHTGSACGCVPQNNQRAIIGNGHTVTLPLSQTTVGAGVANDRAPAGVIVENTGTLQFSANNVTLGIQGNLVRVASGGTINAGVGITGHQIQFQAANAYTIEGGGSLSVENIIVNASNASITNNMTSTLTVGNRITFATTRTNSSFVNNGTITASTLLFDDDNNTFANNGTATFSGNLAANNTDDDGNEIINNTGATLSFVNMDGLATGTGDGAFLSILNSGTINQTGTFLDIENSADARNDINNLNGGVWNYSGSGHDTDIRLFANNGTNNFNYTAAGAQQIITPVAGNGYSNLSLQNSGAKTALGNFSVFGNWTRSGTATFAPATFTVTLSGTGTQSISAVGGETFSNLTVNNTFVTSPQLVLNNPVTVTGTLTMTAGRMNLNGNTFTIGVSAAAPGTLTHGGAGTNGWMYGGSLRRFVANTAIAIGANAGFFPLGSASDFRPFFVSKDNIANSGGSITVTHNNATTTSNVSILDAGPAATISRRHDSNWSVTTSGITSGTWGLRGGGTGFGTIQELPDLRMSTTTGVVGAHAAATGTIADPRVNRTGLTFGQLTNSFHVASIDAVNSPLPVKLLYLNANQIETSIELNWATSLEEGFSHFIIEFSVNGVDFSELSEVEGAGYNTNTKQEYSFLHANPFVGQNYYRLKAVDLDGSYEYFGPIVLSFNAGKQIQLFPNPVSDGYLNVQLNFNPSEEAKLTILNMHGVEVLQILNVAVQNKFEWSALPRGLYILRYSSRDFNDTKKFIVN
ncbi:MAG TPA: T9SS type A sorting domain-containing protein [Cyclobacteriaceae bacterium]|nr:T9SS type A sorting domain-containing protein [Cyclobacteriaceae bacterium]HRJ81838.1 T9SS type A sorting domain-containing protein [Cyclobacteriaceae bacterium]